MLTTAARINKWIKGFVLNMFLLQGFVDDVGIYFGFNIVSWFLCALVFLIAVTIPLLWVIKKVNSSKHGTGKLICIALILFGLEIVYSYIMAHNGFNTEFWLYVFPLARVPEYFIRNDFRDNYWK